MTRAFLGCAAICPRDKLFFLIAAGGAGPGTGGVEFGASRVAGSAAVIGGTVAPRGGGGGGGMGVSAAGAAAGVIVTGGVGMNGWYAMGAGGGARAIAFAESSLCLAAASRTCSVRCLS